MWARRPDTLGLRASCRTRQLQFRGPAVPGVLTRASPPRPSRSCMGAMAKTTGGHPRPAHRAPAEALVLPQAQVVEGIVPLGGGGLLKEPLDKGGGVVGAGVDHRVPGAVVGEVGALTRRIKGVYQHLHAGQAAVCDEAEGVGVQIPRSSAIRARPGTERRASTSSMPGPGSQWPPRASDAPSGMHQ